MRAPHLAPVSSPARAADSNPRTAKALQSLQNFLYTRTITDQVFQAAKDRLLSAPMAPADSVAQITQLAELHRADIIGDVAFAAAKAKAKATG